MSVGIVLFVLAGTPVAGVVDRPVHGVPAELVAAMPRRHFGNPDFRDVAIRTCRPKHTHTQLATSLRQARPSDRQVELRRRIVAL